MKLLCFSDLHRDQQAAARIVELAADVDCVIGAGDFATCRQGIADTLDILCRIEKPAVLVPGNGESTDELVAAAGGWPTARVLHGSGCEIDGVPFWGVGGAIPVTPFGDWSYDFDEQTAAALLQQCPLNAVLVVHSPPFDSVDHDRHALVRGSTAIRQAVEAKRPRLVVCGHIHSEWEKEVQLGVSRILNAGPRGVIIEVA
jgi:Icc-related predicted phosphoesterase